jgi:hypothetical protein
MSDPFYGSRKWRELRALVLKRDPSCRTQGCRRPSTIADHIIPRRKGGADHPSNLRGLCAACHNDRVGGREPRPFATVDGRVPGRWFDAPRNLSGLGAATDRGDDFKVSFPRGRR